MNNNSNSSHANSSSWNPFIPTERDINRTEVLAKKSPLIAGLLTCFTVFAGMIYLNRGLNNLKILGYVFLAGCIFGFVSYGGKNEKELDKIANLVGLCGQVAIVAENIRSVTLARQRMASQENQ